MKTRHFLQHVYMAAALYALCLTNTAKAQLLPAFNTLNENNIWARINCDGAHFHDPENFEAYFIAPYDTSAGAIKRTTIFSSNLWIGGYENSNLHLAAMTYRQNGSDFYPGPLDTVTGATNKTEYIKWNQVWKVTKKEIDSFKLDHNKIPASILYWPAHGLPGQTPGINHAKNLAPYIDVNQNGSYDPLEGDYPDIKGDAALWWVFNDKGGPHYESGADQMGVEIQAMAYVFNKPEDTVLNNTIFFDYKIINRGKNNYNKVYYGLWTDFDLGYAFDDFIASDSSMSAYLAYNGDPFDDGVKGYGNNIPVQSVVFLDNNMSNFIAYNNDWTAQGNPGAANEYYNYLTAHWRYGQQLVNGCDGFNCPGASATNYMYPGHPLNNNLWSENQVKNTPGDRRGVGSTGPFELNSGGEHLFKFAYVFTQKKTGSTNANLTAAYKDIQQVKNYYNGSLSVKKPANPQHISLNLYPNPAQNFVTLQWNDATVENVRIIDATCRQVLVQHVGGVQNKLTINTKHFAGGVYMVMVQGKDKTGVQRLVIE